MNKRWGEGSVKLTITEQYRNMREKILPCYHLIENAMDATRAQGIEPKVCPVRGGTDGARLSWEGLPCPNLCTGGENFHGRFEYIPVEDMELCTKLLIEILTNI